VKRVGLLRYFKLFLRAIRAKDWYYMLGIPLLAYVQVYGLAPSIDALHLLVFCSLYLSFGYLFNNVFDTEEDSAQKNIVAADKNQRFWLVVCLVLFTVFCMYSVYLSLQLLAVCVLVLGLSILYSVPPFRLKDFLLLSLALNGVAFALLYIASLLLLGSKIDTVFALLLFFLFVFLQSLHELEHRASKARKTAFHLSILPFCFISYIYTASIFYLTLAYAAGCLVVFYRKSTYSQKRLQTRYLSMLYGAGLLISLLIN
jgi:4-hydroxybenzoate polyprenyltransferase